MTSSNVADASRHNGHEKSPEEIQLEIARTRSAITEDLLALSEKLSPQHLREGAREVMKDAREEAKEILRDAKDAAIGSLIDMKDRAVESVSDKVTLLSGHAKQAGTLTVGFVTANAVALSLFGLGTGWLLLMLRNRRRHETDYAYRYEGYGYPSEQEPQARRARPDQTRSTDQARSVASRASSAVDGAREQVRRSGAKLSERAHEVGERAGGSLRRAPARTRAIVSDNRFTALALTVAAGVGLGLLLPAGARPRRALLAAGERLWDEAQTVGRQVNARAQRALSGRREERLASDWRAY